jgi:hypothetical protein
MCFDCCKENEMKITKRSLFTKRTHTMDLNVTEEQLERWKNGELIQDVMPHLNRDEREFLMTGAIPGEWEKAFPEEEQ